MKPIIVIPILLGVASLTLLYKHPAKSVELIQEPAAQIQPHVQFTTPATNEIKQVLSQHFNPTDDQVSASSRFVADRRAKQQEYDDELGEIRMKQIQILTNSTLNQDSKDQLLRPLEYAEQARRESLTHMLEQLQAANEDWLRQKGIPDAAITALKKLN